MSVMDTLVSRRTYRRFAQKAVPQDVVDDIVEAVRLSSCGANRQAVRLVVVNKPEAVAKVQPLVKWAAYLPPEQGTPKADELPTLYVAVVQDTSIPGDLATDTGIALANMTLAAWDKGVGSCIMGAHKFNGPKGMGALYCRKGIWPQNLIDGGSQEARHRAGTENVAGIAGMGKALEMATEHLEERMAREKELRDYVIDRILKNIPEARLNGGLEHRLPGNANISFPGLEGETILLDLDMHGICASTGSACNSDSLDPSHVLLSIGVPEEIGHGSMRFTFGPQNTMEEAKYLCDVLEEVIPRRRAMSCMWLQGQNTARHFSLKGEN